MKSQVCQMLNQKLSLGGQQAITQGPHTYSTNSTIHRTQCTTPRSVGFRRVFSQVHPPRNAYLLVVDNRLTASINESCALPR